MKRVLILCLLAVVVVGCAAPVEAIELETEEQKTLYALGLAMSEGITAFKLSAAELELVKAGLTDGVLKNEARVDLQLFGPKIQQMAQTRMQTAAAEQKEKGKAYLAEVSAREGVKKTGTGLLMETIQEGAGNSPAPTDRVKVHYTGKLIDGTVFDSSVQRGEPAVFSLQGVIPCWTEGLQFIKEGGKAKLYCPSDLAYGERGSPPKILPGATLVFDVELLEIVK